MKNILIIEEDPDSLNLIKDILEDDGYNVIGTSRIESAYEIFKRGIALHCVLINLIFNNTEKYELIDEIKEQLRDIQIPIIALTSSKRTNEGALAINRGCQAAIAKPIIEEELLKSITKTV